MSHPLDQHFTLLLSTLQLDEFIDHYRGAGVLSDDDIGVLMSNSPQSTRRFKIDYLVKVAKDKDRDLKNFLCQLKKVNQSTHKNLLDALQSAMKDLSESRRESASNDSAYATMTRSFSSLSLENYSCGVDIKSKFPLICCNGCTSPINIIGHTDDLMGFYKRTNPHGYSHRFYQLQGRSVECRIKCDGEWHKEHSWFENYWWMIINCKDCSRHWGWYFDTTDHKNFQSFYGIREDAICLRAPCK